MKITHLVLPMLLGSACLALAQAPPAGGMGGGRGPMAACRDDMQKYCADKTGPDRRACMQANKDKLSDGCKSAIAARMKAMGQ